MSRPCFVSLFAIALAACGGNNSGTPYHPPADHDNGGGDVDNDITNGTWTNGLLDQQPKFKSRVAVAVGPDLAPQVAYNVATSTDGWDTPEIWYGRRNDGVWATTRAVAADSISREFPVIAVDQSNRPLIAYNAVVPSENQVDVFVLQGSGSGFGTPTNVTASTDQDEWAPIIAYDGGGVLHMIFTTRTSADVYGIGYALIPPGDTTTLETVATGTGAFSLNPGYNLAVEAGGIVHVVYTRTDSTSGGEVLYYRNRDVAGSWSAEEKLTEDDQDVWDPGLAVDAGGTLHLTYVKSPNWDEKTLRYDRRVGGAWVGEQTLTTSVDDRNYYLGTRVTHDGVVHIVFPRFDTNRNADILYLKGQNGVFEAELPLTTTPSLDESTPALAIGSDARLFVAFTENLSAGPDGTVYFSSWE